MLKLSHLGDQRQNPSLPGDRFNMENSCNPNVKAISSLSQYNLVCLEEMPKQIQADF
jgi:hypothetical protein